MFEDKNSKCYVSRTSTGSTSDCYTEKMHRSFLVPAPLRRTCEIALGKNRERLECDDDDGKSPTNGDGVISRSADTFLTTAASRSVWVTPSFEVTLLSILVATSLCARATV